MSFGARLKQYIDHKNLSIRSFELKSSLKNGTVYRVIKNNTSLNGESIAAIGKYWEDLNLNWLIVGKGEMLKSDSTNHQMKYDRERDSSIEAQLNRADEHIVLQKEMIIILKEIIKDQKKNRSGKEPIK